MFEEALKYLFESTSYGVFISIVIIAIIATWRLSRYHHANESVKDKVGKLPCDKHSEKLGKMDSVIDKLDKLPCDKHSEKLGKMDSVIDKLDKLPCDKHSEKINQIDVINAKLDGMTNMIQLLFPNNEDGKSKMVKAKSPISLTDYGEGIVKDLNVREYINENWETISNYIEENSESLNPYDIQQLCFNYVITKPTAILTDKGYDRLKLKAYETGMTAIEILQGVSILIRDRYFIDHNINVDDVDKHDPKKKEDN